MTVYTPERQLLSLWIRKQKGYILFAKTCNFAPYILIHIIICDYPVFNIITQFKINYWDVKDTQCCWCINCDDTFLNRISISYVYLYHIYVYW